MRILPVGVLVVVVVVIILVAVVHYVVPPSSVRNCHCQVDRLRSIASQPAAAASRTTLSDPLSNDAVCPFGAEVLRATATNFGFDSA